MMLCRPMYPQDFKVLSMAVQSWYRHFEVKACHYNTERLCIAAIALFNDGRTGVEEIASGLIEMFPAPYLLKIDARTSMAVH
jgi:hypothetical protein